MNIKKVQNAEAEAIRFLSKVKELEELMKKPDFDCFKTFSKGCSETSAVKRASMDLTRALKELRG